MKSAKAAKTEAEPPPPPPVAAAVAAYVRCVQALLQAQADALTGSLGAGPGLPPLLRQLWLAHLAHARVLEPATVT